MAMHQTARSSALLVLLFSVTCPVAWAQDSAGAESQANSHVAGDQAASAVDSTANSVGLWTSGGPYGGNIQALAIDPPTPPTLYPRTNRGGVYPNNHPGGTPGPA